MSISAIRGLLASPFLFFALTGVVRAQPDEAAKAEVLEVSHQFNEAARTKNQAALDSILADRLSWVARGDRLNKAQVIADYDNPT